MKRFSQFNEATHGVMLSQVQHSYETFLGMQASDSGGGDSGRQREAIRMAERACGVKNVRVSSNGKTVVYFEDPSITEATRAKYFTCPECEANFQLVDGKFPSHRAFKGTGTCPGSGTTPVNEDTSYGVKIVNAPVTGTLQTRVKRINQWLADVVGRKYWSAIPLTDMFAKLKENGFKAVQEDGTEWEGLLLGRDGRANIDLVDMQTGRPAKRWLSLTYHKMEVSGKWEVVAYVS